MVVDAKTRAWLVFMKGEDVARATRYRDVVTAQIKQRWPDTKTIPIGKDGSLPRMSP